MSSSSVDKIRQELGFTHRFIPTNENHNATTLLLLHGTGGDENDLVSIGRQLDPNAALLSPRGKVLERGVISRFFRRLEEGVFDMEDLKFRTNELADFVEKASSVYGFDPENVVAVGYSNGANIAASILLIRPRTLSHAILLRAMVPLIPDRLPNLSGKKILVLSGQLDPIVPENQAKTLSELLRRAGADVTLEWQDSGHELVEDDVIAARHWIERIKP